MRMYQVVAHPVKILKCPNCGAEFDHKVLDGKSGWIVYDNRLATPEKKRETVCSVCKHKWNDFNVINEQNFFLWFLPDDVHPRGGKFKDSETRLLAPEDVVRKWPLRKHEGC